MSDVTKKVKVLYLTIILLISLISIAPAWSQTSEDLDTEFVSYTQEESTEEISQNKFDEDEFSDTPYLEPLKSSNESDEFLVLLENSHSSLSRQEEELTTRSLQDNTQSTQEPVVEELDNLDGVQVENQFWITNSLLATIDPEEVDIERLSSIEDVAAIGSNVEFPKPEPLDLGLTEGDFSGDLTYGLEHIGVENFWEKYEDLGENSSIAILDDGLDTDHPDLEVLEGGTAVFGEVNDTEERVKEMEGDHGAHVAGIATGNHTPKGDVPTYGVAPNASLLKVDVFDGPYGAEVADVLEAMEWAIDEDRKEPADVISMSLGYPPEGDNSVMMQAMDEAIRNAEETGTVVIAAVGNDGVGDSGGPVSSPGSEFNGLSVGASDEDRDIGVFSSGGILTDQTVDVLDEEESGTPQDYPRRWIKPDVTAPGVQVLSAGYGNHEQDPDYGVMSGSSMAAPHVAGAAGLLQSFTEDDLQSDLIKSALVETAEKPEDVDHPSIGERDIRYGTGIINVTAAAEALEETTTVEGEVTDNETGDELVGATIESDQGAITTSANETGAYTIEVTEASEITADIFGYEKETASVELGEEAQTEDFELDPIIDVDILDDQDVYAAFDGGFTTEFEVRNLDTYTVELTDETEIGEENLNISIDGGTFNETDIEFGEGVVFENPVDGPVVVTVDIESNDFEEDDIIGLNHTFEDDNDVQTKETGPTILTEELKEGQFEITHFDAENYVHDGPASTIIVELEVTNVGQQEKSGRNADIDYLVSPEWKNITGGILGWQRPTLEPDESREYRLVTDFPVDSYGSGAELDHGFAAGILGREYWPWSGEPTDWEDEAYDDLFILESEHDHFSVTEIDAPDSVSPNSTIDVTATIENHGNASATQEIEYWLEGDGEENETMRTKQIELDALPQPENTAEVTFEDIQVPDNESGLLLEQQVSTENDSVTVEINVDAPVITVVAYDHSERDYLTPAKEMVESQLDLEASVEGVEVDNPVTDDLNTSSAVYNETDVFVFHSFSATDAFGEFNDETVEEIITGVEDDPTKSAVYLDLSRAEGSNQGHDTHVDGVTSRSATLEDPGEMRTEWFEPESCGFNGDEENAEVNLTINEPDHSLFDGVAEDEENITLYGKEEAGGLGFPVAAVGFQGQSGEALANVSLDVKEDLGDIDCDFEEKTLLDVPTVSVDDDNNSVLLSSITPTGEGMDLEPDDYPEEAHKILGNAVEYAYDQMDVLDEAHFEVNITDVPDEIDTGEELIVEYEVKNVGEQEAIQEIEFWTDAAEDTEPVETETITLDGGENKTENFSYSLEFVHEDILVEISSEDDQDSEVVPVGEQMSSFDIDDFSDEFQDETEGHDYGEVTITVHETEGVEPEGENVTLSIVGDDKGEIFSEAIEDESIPADGTSDFTFQVGTIEEADNYTASVTVNADNAEPVTREVEFTVFTDFGTFEYGRDELDLDIGIEEDKTARWVFYGDDAELKTIEGNDVEFDWTDYGDDDFDMREFRIEIEDHTDVMDINWVSDDLTGKIPPELGQLENLESLYLNSNDLSGEIPLELGQLENLEVLYLPNNDLSGEIPPELSGLQSLEKLSLSMNQLSGEIPVELSELNNLDRLFLNDNDLSGEIPVDLSELENLERLNLQSNDLSGEMPLELGELHCLDKLFLNNNDLSGEIPSEFSNLTQLERVELQDNNFDSYGEGAFSTQSDLGDVESSFDILDISGNDLSTEDVDSILEDLVESLDLENRVPAEVNLIDNSEPSAEGWEYKNTLENEGWEVTVDGEPVEEHELSIKIDGLGTVKINGEEIEMPYSENYTEGTEIDLKAIPDEDWTFEEWIGDHGGEDNQITITIDEDKELTANFVEEELEYDLTIDVEGQGSTDPEEGTHTYEEGTEVTVEATPEEGWTFEEWIGDHGGEDAEITITMDEDKEITAHFSEEPYEFNITVRESDLLVISDALVELRCNETDEVKYDNITDEDGIAHFPEVSEGVYEYTITHEEYEEKTGVAEVYKDKEIDVELEPLDVYRLELNVKGSGMVHIETEDESWELDHDSIKIDFTVDTEVSLYAEADEGWVFSEWTGQVPENKAEEMSFNVTMDEKREMVVHFEEVVEEYDLTFVVEDEWEEPVEGATVMLNGKTVQTDGDGNAVFEDLEPGIYDYEVDHEHFETVEDEVEIVDEDVVEEVTLTEKIVEEYDITFEIEDEDGELIEGAEVTVDGETLETGDEGEVVFEDMEPDSYDYTVEKEGHETVDNYVTIEDEGVTERVILEEESVEKYDITFEIEDEDGELIEGAEVTVDGETLETGDEGEAVFEDMEPDSYDYTVEKEGYETVDNYVTIEDERVTESVILKEDDVVEKYDLTFEVQDEDGENIENAEITVDGETLGTDEEGEAVFEDINSGTYDYTVEKDGYEIVEDELTVDDENVVESVTLMEKEDDDDDTPGFTLLLLVLGLLVAVKLYGGQKQSC